MDILGLQALHRRTAGIDVHRMLHVVTVVIEQDDGSIQRQTPHKKAIIAIAHKMIRLIFLMLSRRQPYIDQGTDYAAMSAKKNAPRWIKQLKVIGRWPAPKRAAAGT